jgi:hypothetical protein
LPRIRRKLSQSLRVDQNRHGACLRETYGALAQQA